VDKRVIFAVAGSGKTTHIVNSLTTEKRSLIITYTTSNYSNIAEKIAKKFHGKWPENITLMSYFQFLYRFCYKPFLSDSVRARGMVYEQNPNRFIRQSDCAFYLTPKRYFYSNRLSLYLERKNVLSDIKQRIVDYFDEFIIDEVQDIAGRDFTFLEHLMDANLNMLFVGDFYQHTYDTSRDGNANRSLFADKKVYEARFARKGVIPDSTTLVRSWRCRKSICEFVTSNLGIEILSYDDTEDHSIRFVSEPTERTRIINDTRITKLHFKESYTFGQGRKNWGDTKGEDCYEDVCVMLNKNTAKLYKQGKLCELAPSTRNKLYVAITRAHGCVYLMYE
jgi:ATP-dependent exoDNAse (exonuclease V) beta subunit